MSFVFCLEKTFVFNLLCALIFIWNVGSHFCFRCIFKHIIMLYLSFKHPSIILSYHLFLFCPPPNLSFLFPLLVSVSRPSLAPSHLSPSHLSLSSLPFSSLLLSLSPRAHLHEVGMLRFMSKTHTIRAALLLFILFLCLFLS